MSAAEGPLPRFARILDFLSAKERLQLLEWALASRQEFRRATVSNNYSDHRVALTNRKLGSLRSIIQRRMLAVLPELMTRTGTGGLPPTSLELELAAHGDGAYYRPHIDVSIGPDRQRLGANLGEDRILSAVYYFYSEPKVFSGGQLRLFSFGQVPPSDETERSYLDLEPTQNSLIAFPSWAPHEVRPVKCPSGQFSHYRFALNCWYCRSLSRI